MGSKRTRNQPVATYTTEDVREVITLFATHITERYDLSSKALRLKMDIAPEALVAIWQNEMEQEVGE